MNRAAQSSGTRNLVRGPIFTEIGHKPGPPSSGAPRYNRRRKALVPAKPTRDCIRGCLACLVQSGHPDVLVWMLQRHLLGELIRAVDIRLGVFSLEGVKITQVVFEHCRRRVVTTNRSKEKIRSANRYHAGYGQARNTTLLLMRLLISKP